MDNFSFGIFSLTGLFEKIIDEVSADKRRSHEKKMKELSIIENSSLRDEYVKLIFLDKFLAPIEAAQHQIQNAAKHAQYLAEALSYYYKDHGLSKEQAQEISTQLRILAVQTTHADSLYDLRILYTAITIFADRVSVFKHQDRKYSLEHGIRKGILDPLNTCIATEKNFQRRVGVSSN